MVRFVGLNLHFSSVTVEVTFFHILLCLKECSCTRSVCSVDVLYWCPWLVCLSSTRGENVAEGTWGVSKEGDSPAVVSCYYKGLGEGSCLQLILPWKPVEGEWRRWAEQGRCNDKDLNGDTMVRGAVRNYQMIMLGRLLDSQLVCWGRWFKCLLI